jgi:hypothetical protein
MKTKVAVLILIMVVAMTAPGGQWFTSTTIYNFSPRFPAKGD